jgi:hypothetical protein
VLGEDHPTTQATIAVMDGMEDGSDVMGKNRLAKEEEEEEVVVEEETMYQRLAERHRQA